MKEKTITLAAGISIMGLILLISLFLVSLTSCSTQRVYQHKSDYRLRSDVTITDETEKIIYIADGEVGTMIYEMWIEGHYGSDYTPVLLEAKTFHNLMKKTNR